MDDRGGKRHCTGVPPLDQSGDASNRSADDDAGRNPNFSNASSDAAATNPSSCDAAATNPSSSDAAATNSSSSNASAVNPSVGPINQPSEMEGGRNVNISQQSDMFSIDDLGLSPLKESELEKLGYRGVPYNGDPNTLGQDEWAVGYDGHFQGISGSTRT